jgi:hypothetical protein
MGIRDAPIAVKSDSLSVVRLAREAQIVIRTHQRLEYEAMGRMYDQITI